MFGYIIPSRGELKVKEYALYGAVYCGLCRSMSHNISRVLSWTLSYDFTFLAMARMALDGTAPQSERFRCFWSPGAKKARAADCDELRYTSAAVCILSYLKALDDVRDERHSPVRRAGARLAAGHFKRGLKKTQRLCPGLYERLASAYRRFEQIEDAYTNSADIAGGLDELAGASGQMLVELLCWNIDDLDRYAAARELAYYTGCFIYIADAIADAKKDAEKGGFNILNRLYGGPEQVAANADELRGLMRQYSSRMLEAARSPHFAGCLAPILGNISALGTALVADAVLAGEPVPRV